MYSPKDVFENPENYIDFLKSKDFEGQFFERKEIPLDYQRVNQAIRDVKDGIKKAISAFANYNQVGGLIVIGINDKNSEVTGLDHLNDTQFQDLLSSQNDLLNHITIPKSFQLDGKQIYLLYVPYIENVICETVGKIPEAYKRMGKKNDILTTLDREQILRDKRLGTWENIILDAEYHEKDIDEKVVENFKRGYLEDSEYDLPIGKILEQIGAIREQKGVWYWTNAGILFFDKSPQRMIAQATVRFVRYDYLLKDKPHLSLTSRDIEFDRGNLPTLLQKVREFTKSPVFRQFTVRNAEGHLQHFDQFPADALEEGIVNALIHRDYALTTSVWCKLYLDAFVVENAGRILQPDRQVPENFTLENYELVPNPRNPRLVRWIKKLQSPDGKPFVKGISEGTRKMRKVMEEMYFPYPIYQTNGVTSMTLQSVATPEEFEELIQKYKSHNPIGRV